MIFSFPDWGPGFPVAPPGYAPAIMTRGRNSGLIPKNTKKSLSK